MLVRVFDCKLFCLICFLNGEIKFKNDIWIFLGVRIIGK